MRQIFFALIAASLAASGGWAAESVEKAPLAAQPFPLQDVRLLDGPFKQIQELHRTGMVGQLEPDRLLFPFRKNAGLPQPAGVTKGYGGWDDGFCAGHYAGHYLTAAARMYAATGDTSFRDKATYMVKVLGECQDKLGGGYLSAFPSARLDRLEADPRRGLVEYYIVHKILAGLVDVARECDNRQALEIAERLSDYVAARMAKLSPAQVEALLRTDYTGNPVNEFGGMAEGLADLYAVARQQGAPNPERHLKLALLFNRDWFVDPLFKGEDKLNGIHANTHAAQVGGIARCALETGDARLGTAADAFWKLVVQKHSFVNGGNGFDEKLRAAGTEVAGMGEAALRPITCEYCGTYNMLKITSCLFQRAPAVAYGDYYENALFNHILAGIGPDHGKVLYHMSMRPGDYRVHIDEPYCCQGTGIEDAARFGEAIYFHRGDELWVNLYIASTLDWHEKGLKLRLDTRYPEDGVVRLTVAAAVPVVATLNFRMPGWLQEPPEARVNGQSLSDKAMPGTFLAVTRTWKDGDVVELRFPLGLRVRPSMDDPVMVSFFYGPVLLAGKLGREGMPASDVGGHMSNQNAPRFPVPVLVTPSTEAPATLLKPVPGKPITYAASMVGVVDRKPVEVELAPFYQVHHQRYALYWKVLKPEELDPYAERQAKLLPKAASFIGDTEAEKSRNMQGERTSSGAFAGRMWRAATDGGWFSYRLPVAAGDEQDLACTYWGGETGNRVFDILVEDTKIATQTLHQDKPNEFFDVAYRIPSALVRGKQFVTVRFQAHPGATAGGIFHCAIVKSATTPGRRPAEEIRPIVRTRDAQNAMHETVLEFRDGATSTNDTGWALAATSSAAKGIADARDYCFTWTLTKGEAPSASVGVVFEFTDWSPENFVFVPAAVYDGNRFAIKNVGYPPYWYDKNEWRLDMPTTMGPNTPTLGTGPGNGRIHINTGNASAPLLAFQSPAKHSGWIVQTTQGSRLGNHELDVQEIEGRTVARFEITTPAANWKAGDSITLPFRVHRFAASQRADLLQRFAAVRKDLNPSQRVEELPFSAAWKLESDLYRDHRWDERTGLFWLTDPAAGHTQWCYIWQLGWCGGGQATLPLLMRGDEQARQRALRNLDVIFTRMQAASGFFNTMGNGHEFASGGLGRLFQFNESFVRSQGDWLFMAQRQFQQIEASGNSVPVTWTTGLKKLADAFVRLWEKQGQFGQLVNVETGDLCIGGSTGGAIVPGALALASQIFHEPLHLKVAEESARKYYRDFVPLGYTTGGPGDILSAPDSESAFALFESLVVLHEVTGKTEWLRYAEELLPICASWVVAYDYEFPPNSALGLGKVHSCGAVWASVPNKHGAPGIPTWSGDSLLKYYRATGDRRALELLTDVAHGITQYISRPDRPIGRLPPGGICERVNLSDWEGKAKVGGNIFDSCSWIETATMLTLTQLPGLYVQPDTGVVAAFDNIRVEQIGPAGDTVKLRLSNPTKFPAEVTVLAESSRAASQRLPSLTAKQLPVIHLDSGGVAEIECHATGQVKQK